MKTIHVSLTSSELSYLIVLLHEEVESGDYWGNQDRHYARRDKLLAKLEKVDNGVEHGHN